MKVDFIELNLLFGDRLVSERPTLYTFPILDINSFDFN